MLEPSLTNASLAACRIGWVAGAITSSTPLINTMAKPWGYTMDLEFHYASWGSRDRPWRCRGNTCTNDWHSARIALLLAHRAVYAFHKVQSIQSNTSACTFRVFEQRLTAQFFSPSSGDQLKQQHGSHSRRSDWARLVLFHKDVFLLDWSV